MMENTDRAWIELDMNNLRHNINIVRSLLPDGCQLMAVLKANAYGHGAVEIAKGLNSTVYAHFVSHRFWRVWNYASMAYRGRF